MAAPNGITWGPVIKGSTSGRQGCIGIYTNVTNTATQSTVNVQVWFWSIYSCSDSANNVYCDIGTKTSAASTNRGTVTINHTVATGEGWSTSNQTRIYNYTNTYNRGTSDAKYNVYAKFSGIDMLGGTMYHNRSVTVPKLQTYTITYDANGGTGAPGKQTKYHGINAQISTKSPTRTGYTFGGWSLTKNGSTYYTAGSYCGKNENITIYAVWTPITYVISYNANGGVNPPANQTKTHGTKLTLRTQGNMTKTNHTFLGWSTDKYASVKAYSAGGSYSLEGTRTLYAVWSLSYKAPTISGVSVVRCDSNGSASDSGTYARVIFNWTTTNEVTSITIEWESSNGITSSKTVSQTGKSGSVSERVGNNDISPDIAYTVRISVSDSGGSWVVSRNLPSKIFVIDALKGGKGIAFGKTAELETFADFGFKTRHRADMCVDNNVSIYGTSPSGVTRDILNPTNANGNTVLGWGNYDLKNGNTNIYGANIHLGVSFNAPEGTAGYTWRPYNQKGDTINVTIRTAGYVTNSKQDITFFVPVAKPIIGNPTITASSRNGFVLRQGDAYTHGSGSSTYTSPDSYSAGIVGSGSNNGTCGIYVTARFSNTTNCTNNDAIGVYWDGTITFS